MKTEKGVRYFIPLEVENGLQEIARLDKEEEQLETKYQQIKRSSPVMQLPKAAYDILNQEVDISKKKAEIWNNIRHYIVSSGKPRVNTLWQVAIDKGLPVKMFGEEHGLDFGAEEIRNILSKTKKAKREKKLVKV